MRAKTALLLLELVLVWKKPTLNLNKVRWGKCSVVSYLALSSVTGVAVDTDLNQAGDPPRCCSHFSACSALT